MIRFRLYYDKDRETEFLNEMSGKGYALTGFCAGFYHFDRCEPGEHIYQVDITEGLWKVSTDYREFMRDMNVEIVCLWGPWVILRKKAAEGPFVLYTDVESSIEHYTRIKTKFKACAVVELLAMSVELVAALQGTAIAWGFFFLLGAILAAFIRQLLRINRILDELKGRTDECRIADGRRRRPYFSGFLTLGLFLNAIALMMPGEGSYGRFEYLFGFLKGAMQGGALMFMIIGFALSFWKNAR